MPTNNEKAICVQIPDKAIKSMNSQTFKSVKYLNQIINSNCIC